MKKVIAFLFIAAMAVGCKSKSATNNNLDFKEQLSLKGDWKITSVDYPNSEYIKVTSFDLVDSNCFVGSLWTLISNNNSGRFDLTNDACSIYSSNITWFINKENQFVMKILNQNKAKKVETGYVLEVANVSQDSFQLVDKINVGGKMTNVVYKFERR